MPRFIIKIKDDKLNKDWYLEWSTVVDAPLTYGLSLDEFKEYYKQRYGTEGMINLQEILKRVEERGISGLYPYDDLETYFQYNRAGEKESYLDKEGILESYCRISDEKKYNRE